MVIKMEVLHRPTPSFHDHGYDASDSDSDGEIHFERPIYLRPPTRGSPLKSSDQTSPRRAKQQPSIDIVAAQQSLRELAPLAVSKTFAAHASAGTLLYMERSTFSSGSDSISSVASPPTDRTHFIRRFFSRRAAPLPEPKPVVAETQMLFAVTPSPHTHPLLTKPYARDEVLQGAALAIAQSKFGETRSSPKSLPSPREDFRGSVSTTSTLCAEESPRERSGPEWAFFQKCYAEGRFNLSNPPEPPPRQPGSFSAPTPPNEPERVVAANKFNILYPEWATAKILRSVSLARRVFQTRCAALSIVDESGEVFKAEIGFNRKSVPRADSLGAHVLLSSEPMVILDTHKDWRMQANPLVTGSPYIRFFAGAPIVNAEGITIGAFCVFDPQPKEEFTVASKRKLVDFTKVAIADMELIMDELAPSDNKKQQRLSSSSSKSDDDSSSIEGGSVRMKRNASKLLKSIEEEADSCDRGRPALTTSRSYDRLGEERVSRSRPRSASQRPESLRLSSARSSFNVGDRQSKTSVILVDVPTPPQTPSRPFSIASYNSHQSQPVKQPPNTPAMSDRPVSNASDSSNCGSRRGRQRLTLEPSNITEKRSNVHQLPRSPGPVTSTAEAKFATALLARNYNYDLVYLLRVKPARPDSTEEELQGADGLNTWVICSQGMPDPEPIFDSGLHLKALRSDGGLIYQNPSQEFTTDDEVGYRLGALLPLHREEGQDDPKYGCRSGVVLAAYRKKGNRLAQEELALLREGGEALRNIFINAPDKRSSARSESF